jgi:hypothetical protein
LSPEQIAAQNALIEQDRLQRADWDAINKALRDDAMSVTRGIGRWYRREGDRERHTERVLSRYASGSFLIDRLGAIGVVDQDLVVVLLDLRRRLIDEYGGSPATPRAAPRPTAAANASATSGRTAAGSRSSIHRRSTGNTGSPASGRTAPRPTGCACASKSAAPPPMAAAHRPVCTRSKRPVEKPPIDLTRQPHQRMAEVDDVLQHRPQQVPLPIVSWLCHLRPARR